MQVGHLSGFVSIQSRQFAQVPVELASRRAEPSLRRRSSGLPPTGNPPPGPDTLAYYLPYHFYYDGIWGIYLKATGILELAAELKVAPITHGDDDAIQAALISLFEHELFHCLTEQAATRAEVVVRLPVYRSYFFDRYAGFHEEAAANASAHSKVRKTHPAYVAQLEAWMKSQGPGYRDFPQLQSDIEFNATEARRVQESGQDAIETKKDPLPTAAQRKAELGY
jgi:hypothetical protein